MDEVVQTHPFITIQHEKTNHKNYSMRKPNGPKNCVVTSWNRALQHQPECHEQCILQGANVRMALVPATHLAVTATYRQPWLPLQDLCDSRTAPTTFKHILPDAKPPQASEQRWVNQQIEQPQEVAGQPSAVGEIKHS